MEYRKIGFYWVKYQGVWQIAYWEIWNWEITGSDDILDDSDFDEIDERIIERQES